MKADHMKKLEELSQIWKHKVCCPRCASPIINLPTNPTCSNDHCEYSSLGFPVVDEQPVLIDFVFSVFDREMYRGGNCSVIKRDVSGRSISSRLHRFTFGKNQIAAKNCERFLSLLKQEARRPTVLVIGGATIGSGAGLLYSDPSVEVIGTDVFSSENTVLVADAHKLPFLDGTFNGVWIQAVLEHVLEPVTVVAEIHRVLRTSGIVYAETPFMQQVHERAYDFTRFTQSGHRWLFKYFTEISAGPVSGPGVVLLWSIRYFARALGAGDKVSRLFPLLFFWLRYLDVFARGRAKADAASGLFFLGRRADLAISPASMPSYYDTQH
jgi:SAM-dependent methyltransferase